MKFTYITEKMKYPPKYMGKLLKYHSDIITYTVNNFKNTNSFKHKVIDVFNAISCLVISGDTIPQTWNCENPLVGLPELIDAPDYTEILGDLYINYSDIEWDLEEVDTSSDIENHNVEVSSITKIKSTPIDSCSIHIEPTPKEFLYINPPVYPQFDVNKPWLNVVKDGEQYTIYTSLPLIPTSQNEISVTTDINLMSESDLLNLFPNRTIHTRAAIMYEPHGDILLDEDLGLIIPISGFTEEQVRDNIIRYPHLYKLLRLIDGKPISFYSQIEIDGELHNTMDIWDSLPESGVLPRNSDFIKEYVVRRYLLERDILGIEHKYSMFGSLKPFLTLFTTPKVYAKYGYDNSVELAKSCVESRVDYKQSRNPILRKVYSLQ